MRGTFPVAAVAAAASLLVSPGCRGEEPPTVPVGLIVSNWAENAGVAMAIDVALERQHGNRSSPFRFKLWADRINTVDAYKMSKIICRQFDRGVLALMGTVDPESFDTLRSYADSFEMPFLTPWFPESIYGLDVHRGGRKAPAGGDGGFAIQLRPDYHEALVDVITYYGWGSVVYVYSDFDGLLRLQNLYASIPRDERGEYRFRVDMVRKVSSAAEALQFLLELERADRYSLKRVILDCSETMAKVGEPSTHILYL